MGTARRVEAPQAIGPCPSCMLHRLRPFRVAVPEASVEIDVCPVCEGAFFDPGELDAVRGKEPVEDLLGPTRIPRRPQRCPRCASEMQEHAVPAAPAPCTVARCPSCGGIFLDGATRRRLARATFPKAPSTTAYVARRSILWLLQLLVHLPVEVRNPTGGFAPVTAVFSILAILAFAVRVSGTWDLTPLTLDPARFTGPLPALHTALSYALVHGSWWHLIGNLYFLYTFGDNVEHVFGPWRFCLFAALVTAAGAVAYVIEQPPEAARVAGASGLVAGVLAAYLWTFPRSRLFHVIFYLQFELPAWVYVLLWAGFQGVMLAGGLGANPGETDQVAWSVHAGSFIAGLALTPLFHLWIRAALRRGWGPEAASRAGQNGRPRARAEAGRRPGSRTPPGNVTPPPEAAKRSPRVPLP